MVVRQIHIVNVPVLETEHDPPVAPNCNAPETSPIAFERMQPEAGQSHVLGRSGTVQHSQDVLHLPNLIRVDGLWLVLLEQPPESFVPETLDH